MTRLNDTLPDLMRRATDDLEPVSTDLLERTVHQGLTLRRRRTVLRAGAASAAVLATAGLIAGGTQLLATKQEEAPAATGGVEQTTTTKTAAAPAKPPVVTHKETLVTLRKLVQAPGRTLTRPESRTSFGYNFASLVLNDGKGESRIEVGVHTANPPLPCVGAGMRACTRRPDGSNLWSYRELPEYPGKRNVDGVVSNGVTIQYRDGRTVSLTSYNAPQQKGIKHTRTKPLLSVEQLTAIAADPGWKFPPAQPAPPSKERSAKANSK